MFGGRVAAGHALGPAFMALGFEGWRQGFSDTSALVCRSVAPRAAAIFFQTDVKRDGAWVDKAYLVQRGAEAAGSALLWHKVVCRAPAGTATFGRPAYAHLLCFSKELRLEPKDSTADVLPRLGEMTWARAMGVEARYRTLAGDAFTVDYGSGFDIALLANFLTLAGMSPRRRNARARPHRGHRRPRASRH